MNNIRQHLIARVEHFTKVVNQVYPHMVFPVPKVEYFSHRKASGFANKLLHTVSFNTVLAQENVDAFDNTIIHELSHLVIGRLYPLGGKLAVSLRKSNPTVMSLKLLWQSLVVVLTAAIATIRATFKLVRVKLNVSSHTLADATIKCIS